ncbi:TetR/AcrR family transcriptional regulator [Amycolatopsis rhizosphaerae]|uniref:TetR/AcrR family transcriptional regulator n=1 Tax=Amycolatopsis rhizosphaerae TaxID=2053003 RepID=UPI001FE7490C|nr:TetR/AcrR family transcriptional regulator [Amycolatopsis rhizosphaerae]
MIEAVLAELSGGGYEGLTVETVATRSGVHKATIYRRWGGVDGLVADALAHSAEAPWPIPDTGTLAGDLQEITRAVLIGFTDPHLGATATALINAALRSTQGARALAAFFAARLTQAAQVVTRAIDRGELPPGVDAVEVVRAATAPLYYRLFITDEPVDDDVANRAAAAAVAAARAGVFDTAMGEQQGNTGRKADELD